MYLNEAPNAPVGRIAGWLQGHLSHQGAAPRGTVGFRALRGGTARTFVEVMVDRLRDIEEFKREFVRWISSLPTSSGGLFRKEWADPYLYVFRSVGVWSRPT